MICFHGFGQSATYFQSFAEALSDRYSVIAVDLFFHGKSYWNRGDEVLKKAEWREMMLALLEKEGIDSRFGLCGFSLGGKFALACLEAFPDRISSIRLLAPDGVKTSFWYSLATYPGWFRNYFKQIVVKPDSFFNLVAIMKGTRLVDKGVAKFAKYQMQTYRKRHQVYYAWVVFSDFNFEMKKISRLINERNIPLEMYLGKYDKIITTKNMNRLLGRLDDYKLAILEVGHNHLINDVAQYIAKKQD
ncbi:MAG: alpha/beta hydrolase [Cyclobacteriaceae bacterium]|nr:alpha/beta hydrolase [Cyclobacteriaceae bacterium]